MPNPVKEALLGQKGDVFVRSGGLPFRANPEQASAMQLTGTGTPIGQEEAQQAANAQRDLSYVDQNWGSAGTLGLGALSGLTLGLGPGLLARSGVLDPNLIGAAQTSPEYTAGDIGGLVLPALLSGGDSLAARLASVSPAGLATGLGAGVENAVGHRLLGSVLSETPGLLGRLASQPISLAARGATEGALIGLGHQIGDNLVQNKPLSAEAMAALEDGMLWGGLSGGALGTVSMLGSAAREATTGLLGKAARSNAAKGVLANHIGMNALDVAEAEAAEGGFTGKVGRYQEVLNRSGSGLGDTTSNQIKALKSTRAVATDARASLIQELDSDAQASIPSAERINDRLRKTVIVPREGTVTEGLAKDVVGKLESELPGIVPDELRTETVRSEGKTIKPKPMSEIKWNQENVDKPLHKRGTYKEYLSRLEPYSIPGTNQEYGFKVSPSQKLTWKGLVSARDALASELEDVGQSVSAKDSIRRDVLNALDDEIRKGMEQAGELNPNLKGVENNYGAATADLKIMDELDHYLGKKDAERLLKGGTITPHNVAMTAGIATLGHPWSAAGYLGSRVLVPKLIKYIEPGMAKMAANHLIGSQAEGAAQVVKSRIGKALDRIFTNSSRAATTVQSEKTKSMSFNRKAYEDAANQTEQWLSQNHQDAVRRYSMELTSQGYPELGSSVMDSYQRAYEYALWNQSTNRKGAKNMGSLRKIPVDKGLDMKESKFLRIFFSMTKPLDVLDKAAHGHVSIDEIRTIKYTAPEIHAELVNQATQKVYEAKMEGKYLPLDKISWLGIMLDAPIDTTLTKEFISNVQQGLATNQPKGPPGVPQSQQGPQPPGPPPQAGGMTISPELMTPVQKAQA